MASTATNDKVIRIRSDISEPIADIQRLKAAYTSLGGVNPALAAMVNNLNAAGGASGRAGAAAAAANNNVRSLTGSLGGMGNAANAALSRLSGMTGALGGIATAGAALGVTAAVGGLVALGTAAVKASAQMESYRASLTTILGDQDKATQAMDRLVEFAQKTPFALNQAVEGFTKLKALGLQPTEAAMMSYGNTASALGKDLNQMVEAVADAATGEFERLKEFGIKSSKEGDKVRFTFQGVTKEVANNSTAIQGYLMGIGNVNFAGAMEKQMQTFNGAMSNLEDTWNQTLAAIGDGGLNTSVAKVINLITSGITGLTPILVGVGNVMGGVVSGVASIASGFVTMFTGITSNGGQGLTFIEGLTVALNVTGQAAQVVGNIVGASLGAIGTVAGAVTNTVRSVFSGLWDWLGVSSAVTGQNMGAGIMGALRAAKFVSQNLQVIFSTALGAIGGSFALVGQRIAAFLSGNYNAFDGMGGALKAQFASAGEVLNGIAVKANAIANDQKGAAAAWDRLKGGTGKKGGATLDQLAGAAPTPDASAGKADKDAAKKAADRAKRENDFWQSLKDQLATAGMLSNAADVYNKQLEYRKIIERDLTAGEQARVATALGEINSAKAITGLKQKQFEAANEYTVELGRAKGLTDTQRGVEDDLFKARLDSLNKGVDINSAAYKLAEDDLKKQLDKNAALKVQNDLLAKAKDFAASMSPGARAAGDLATLNAQYKAWQDSVAAGTMSDTFRDQIVAGYENAKLKIEQDAIRLVLDMSPTADRNARVATANGNLKEALAGLSSMGLSPEVRKRIEDEIYTSHSRALGKIASETTREWVEQFDDLADYFGGKMGSVLSKIADGFDSIADMMSGKLTGPAGMFAKIFKTEGTYQKTAEEFSAPAIGKALGSPLKSLSDGFGDFKSMFSGNLAQGLTKGLSKLQAGSQIGGMVGGVGDLLGLGKGFSTGSQIGGALGGLFGPIGSIVGSLGGGLIGSLFGKSKPQASAGFSVVDGKATGGLATGKGSGARDTASALAANVADGLNKVAAELGGSIGSLSGVSVGYRPGHKAGAYRVDTTGRGNLTGVAAFETEAEAIAFAIKDAIADGAITGLAPIIQKALSGLGADAAIAFAKDWKAAMNDYQSLIDPVAAGVSAIIDPLNALRATMVKVGASTEDLTKIDDYRTIKLKAALKEQLSSLNDFMSSLKGEGSGITKMDQLNAKMVEFDSYKARVANGDSNIDQAAFTSLGQSIFGLAGDIYGTATAEFQSYRTMLMGVTQGLTDNVSNAFGKAAGYDVANTATSIDNTTAAIQAQAAQAAAHYQAQAASNALQESWLKQIAANTANNGSTGYQSANDDVAMNGRYGGSTY